MARVLLAVLLAAGLAVWRLVSNLLLWNQDFMPLVSPADVGGFFVGVAIALPCMRRFRMRSALAASAWLGLVTLGVSVFFI